MMQSSSEPSRTIMPSDLSISMNMFEVRKKNLFAVTPFGTGLPRVLFLRNRSLITLRIMAAIATMNNKIGRAHV